MAPNTLRLVSVGIKAAVLFLIFVVVSLGSYGIFGSDAYKTKGERAYTYHAYDTRHETERAFVALAVLSFVVGCATLAFFFIPPSEDSSLWLTIGDIGVCTVSATLLTIGGIILMTVATAECSTNIINPLTSIAEGAYYGTGCPYTERSMNPYECYKKNCRKLYLTPVKMAAAVIALVIGILGFCAPCGIAVKIYKKEPQNAGDVMGVGGYQQVPGGAVVAVSPPQYQMYVAPPPPPQYQVQYGGAYGYAAPQPVAPQMSPSQNPVMVYPQGASPPQGIPQYAPQGGQ